MCDFQWLKKTSVAIFIFCVIVSAPIQRVFATDYYVDNVTGLNTNLGTSLGAAWQTLAKAATVASGGDTVYVVNNGSLYPFRERLAPARSGTNVSNPIRFLGYNGSPILLGTDDYSHNVSSGWLWHASAVSGEYYLTKNNGNPSITQPLVLATTLASSWSTNGVDALMNRGTGTIGSLGAGQWNWGNNDSLGYNTIYYRLASGENDITTTHIEGGVDGATRRNPILVAWEYIDIENFKVRFSNHAGVLNQTLSNYVTYNNIDSSYTGRSGLGIAIFHNLTVTNSRFDHNGLLLIGDTTGIQLSGTTDSTIKNNVISNGLADSGINVKAGSNGNIIENNIIFNNAQHGIDISTSSLNNTLYNNTLYHNGSAGINVESTSTGNVIKNNIMANNLGYQLAIFDSGSTTGLVSNYNSFYFTDTTTSAIRYVSNFYSLGSFATYQSVSGQDANSFTSNPSFLNGSGSYSVVGDFKLLPTSPLINTGASVGITADYAGASVPQGASSDIGAYEFAIPSSPSAFSQYASDGSTVIAAGGNISETSVKLRFAMSSTNGSDSLTPQVELQPVGTSFSNVVTNTGSAVTYTSGSVTGELTISGLSNNTSYHWQARVTNIAGSSGWVSTGQATDFVVLVPSSTVVVSSSSPVMPASTTLPPTCGESKPASVPDIFQINITGTTAILFFTPINNTNDFYLSYSTQPSAEEHGGNVSLGKSGVQQYAIRFLKPYTRYYFKVRGQHGCAVGDWSSIFSAVTGKKNANVSTLFTKYLSLYTSPTSSIKFTKSLSPVSQLLYTSTHQPTPTPQKKLIPQMYKKKCVLWWCW